MAHVRRSHRLRDRFASQDLHAMIELYRSGVTAQQVAQRFGVSESSVKRLLHQNKVTRSTRCLRDHFSTELLQMMIELCRAGTTARQIAEEFRVSERSIKRLLHQHGVRRERQNSAYFTSALSPSDNDHLYKVWYQRSHYAVASTDITRGQDTGCRRHWGTSWPPHSGDADLRTVR
ncbi:MAG: helix-turn-helix domain-containing protein [Pseudonocardiaceae bacterium]